MENLLEKCSSEFSVQLLRFLIECKVYSKVIFVSSLDRDDAFCKNHKLELVKGSRDI